MPSSNRTVPRGDGRKRLARRLKARFLYDPGSIASLAATTGYQPSTVRTLLIEVGVHSEHACLGMSDAEIATSLKRRYAEYPSFEQLSRETGIDRRKIASILASQGVKLKVKKSIPAHLIPELIRKYNDGASLRDLGWEINSAPTTVRRTLLANGVTPRTSGPTKEDSSGGHS